MIWTKSGGTEFLSWEFELGYTEVCKLYESESENSFKARNKETKDIGKMETKYKNYKEEENSSQEDTDEMYG
jgi:hypothetical protein